MHCSTSQVSSSRYERPPRPRHEQPPARRPHLVLHLSPSPTPQPRRARHRLDQLMRAHRHEPLVVLALLDDEHRVHRRLHVVVDAAMAHPAEETKRAFVRVEHPLLALARIALHQNHPAVAHTQVRGLHPRCLARPHHLLVAPVELTGLDRSKHQRHISPAGRQRRAPASPPHRVAANRVIAAAIPKLSQSLEAPQHGADGPVSSPPPHWPPGAAPAPPPHGPSFGSVEPCVQRNDVSSLRITFRTVLRDSLSSRAICLVGTPLPRCSRRTRAVVSTISISPHLARPISEASCCPLQVGGQFWTPTTPARGSISHAEQHSRVQALRAPRRAPGAGPWPGGSTTRRPRRRGARAGVCGYSRWAWGGGREHRHRVRGARPRGRARLHRRRRHGRDRGRAPRAAHGVRRQRGRAGRRGRVRAPRHRAVAIAESGLVDFLAAAAQWITRLAGGVVLPVDIVGAERALEQAKTLREGLMLTLSRAPPHPRPPGARGPRGAGAHRVAARARSRGDGDRRYRGSPGGRRGHPRGRGRGCGRGGRAPAARGGDGLALRRAAGAGRSMRARPRRPQTRPRPRSPAHSGA